MLCHYKKQFCWLDMCRHLFLGMLCENQLFKINYQLFESIAF